MADKHELTEQEQIFIDALFESGGSVPEAKKIAGYAPGTNAHKICERLVDEIIKRTEKELAIKAPRAAFKMSEVMEDPTILGASNQLAATKEILDRIGIVKKERQTVVIETPNAVLILPAKDAE